MGKRPFNPCKHFNGTQGGTCEAGVVYKDQPFYGKPEGSWPCFTPPERLPDQRFICSLAVFRTAEELAEENAQIAKSHEDSRKARQAIVAFLGGPWKRGLPGRKGTIDCPVCGVVNGLHFSRSGYNGHIHAQCETDKCVCWME